MTYVSASMYNDPISRRESVGKGVYQATGLGEGEVGYVETAWHLPQNHCKIGLSPIANAKPILHDADRCMVSIETFLCTFCGNGICEDKENSCN